MKTSTVSIQKLSQGIKTSNELQTPDDKNTKNATYLQQQVKIGSGCFLPLRDPSIYRIF